MIAAVAMLSMGAMSCKAAPKDTDEDADVEQTDPKTAEASSQESKESATEPGRPAFVVKDLSSAKVDTVGYTTTPSGLMYKEVRAGSGKQPVSPSATVKVNYAGKHLNGEVFDSSYERNEPIEFPLNMVIKGWTEGVMLMKEGSKYQFIIPAGLAYGQRGTPGGPIQPNEDLYFEVELLEVK